MKIYLISLKEHDYDEYDGWIVIADTEEEVKQICDIKKTKGECNWCDNQYEDNIEYIKEIGTAHSNQKKGIVLGSFNAG